MKMMLPRSCVVLVPPLVVLMGLVGLAGCEESGVEERTVPEGVEVIDGPAEPPPPAVPAEPAGPAGPTEAPDAAAASWPWTAPAGWRFVDESRPMRLATYVIETDAGPDADLVEVAISRFPGDVGGMLANVNRWRGQVGLPPAGEDELDGMMDRFENPGFVGHTMRLDGPSQHMLVASISEPGADRTWFVRVTTDATTADAVEAEVFGFARSFGSGGDGG